MVGTAADLADTGVGTAADLVDSEADVAPGLACLFADLAAAVEGRPGCRSFADFC